MPDTIGIVRYAPNICQCGHDYVAHINPTLPQSGTCSQCAAGNIHAFTADNEIWPTAAFPETIPARFCATPFPAAPPAQTTINHVGGYPVNTLIVIVSSGAGVQPGMTIIIGLGTGSEESYLITGIQGNNIGLLSPGLRVAVAQSAQVNFRAADGSSPPIVPNGQRGG